jgi:hypothetical protein
MMTVVATNLENGAVTINVYDELGKMVQTRQATVADNRLIDQLDIRGLANAVYIINVTDISGKLVRLKCVKD